MILLLLNLFLYYYILSRFDWSFFCHLSFYWSNVSFYWSFLSYLLFYWSFFFNYNFAR